MKIIGLIITMVCLLPFQDVMAQIQGKVRTADKTTIPYATVNLIDSTKATRDYAISDENGAYRIATNPQVGDILVVSVVGFESLVHPLETTLSENPIDLILKKADKNTIDEVVVTAKKPLIESRLGKLTYNVENTPLVQTSSVIDILGKAPGVFTNPQTESVTLNGKKVLVLTDGRKTYLDGAQLYQYLNNLQAGTIEKIELINNPSAKYDAGAVINIITKKDKSHGWNASLTNSSGYGKQPETKSSGFFNYRNKHLALTASIGGNYDKSPTTGSLIQETNDYRLDQRFNSLSKNDGLFGKVSLDYFLNTKHTLGIAYSRNQTGRDNISRSSSNRQDIGLDLKNFRDINLTDNSFYRDLYSVNYTAALGENKKLLVNADYSGSNSGGNNHYETRLGDNLYRNTLNDLSLDNNLFSANVDYEDLWLERFGIEIGGRVTNISTNNESIFRTENGAGSQMPEYQEDRFNYHENVYAGYMTVSTELGDKVEAQVGIRGEYTKTEGNSLSMGLNSPRNYFDLFPSISVDYALNNNHMFTVSFDKSIDRPSFRTLNPFRYYSDIYSASEGNPYLNPAYNYEGSLQYMFKRKYVFTAGYEQIRGDNQQYYVQDPETETLVSRYENYGRTSMFVLGAYVPVDFTKWWTTRFQVQLLQLSVQKDDFNKSGPGLMANTSSTFKLPKSYFIELVTTYQYASAYGIYKIDPVYAFNVSASKSFFENKFAVKAQALDVGSLYRWHASTTQNNVFYNGRSRGRGAMYMLSLTYKIGKSTVKGSNAKSKSLGSDQSRAN